jgi:putative ABC transport system permease protein
MRWLTQVASITTFNLRSMVQRKGSAAAAIFGIAGVVLVFVAVLSIAQGFRRAMTVSGREDTAIVLRSGASSEMMSGLGREETRIIAETAGVARSSIGQVASPELFVIIDLPKRSTGTSANVPLRGVEEPAFEVRDGLRIVEGRTFAWGRNEVIVGVGAAREFAGLDVGGSLDVGGEEWAIVGIFEDGGGISESEVWTDARLLQSAYRRGDSFQAVYAKLETVDTFTDFRDELSTDPRVNVTASRQTDYYSDQSILVSAIITGLGTLIAGMMALGAIIGAFNTMYTAVSSRTREIATLRALGFKGGPIVLSVLIESVVLAVVGGFVGGLLAWLVFDGFRATTINWQSFSQVAFAFAVTPALLIQGAILAAFIGLIGGLVPAIHAARLPVADALRRV